MCPVQNNQLSDKARVLTEDPSPPSTGANRGAYFVKDVGGVAEAFFKDDQSREIQLTLDGVPNNTGGGGGSTTLAALTDTNIPTPANGNFLKYNGTEWVGENISGGGDMLASNNLSDVLNAVAALNNIGGEPVITAGTSSQYLKGDKTLGTFATEVSANSSVAANTSKVSASGSVGVHSDVNLTGITNGQFLKWNGSSFLPETLAGGGDLLSTNNLSDVANASTSLANLGGEPSLTVGAATQYFKGNKTLGTFATDVSAVTAVVNNTAKVSADGSIASHSDVVLTSIAVGNVLQWNGSNFAPVSLPGGGDLLSTNDLSDVANVSTALANLSGLDKTDIVSQAEAEAGTATTARTWTALRVKQSIAALAGSGGGLGVEFKIQLGAGGTIADKVSNAPVGGIPAGWSIKDGDDAGVHAQLVGNASDLIIEHLSGKVAVVISSIAIGGFGGWDNLDFSAPGDFRTEDLTRNQTRVTAFNTAAGANASILFIKLVDFIV